MTDPKLQPDKPADQPVTYADTIAELRRIADVLEALGPNPLPPGEGPPWLSLSLLLDTPEGVDIAAQAILGSAAEDRDYGDGHRFHVASGSPLFGRGALAVQVPLPRLDADTGDGYSDLADRLNPEAVAVPAEALGIPLGHAAQGLVPAPIAKHYETGGWNNPVPGGCGVDCACGVGFGGFDTLDEAVAVLKSHIDSSPA